MNMCSEFNNHTVWPQQPINNAAANQMFWLRPGIIGFNRLASCCRVAWHPCICVCVPIWSTMLNMSTHLSCHQEPRAHTMTLIVWQAPLLFSLLPPSICPLFPPFLWLFPAFFLSLSVAYSLTRCLPRTNAGHSHDATCMEKKCLETFFLFKVLRRWENVAAAICSIVLCIYCLLCIFLELISFPGVWELLMFYNYS